MERLNRGSDFIETGLHAEWLESKWYALFVRSNQEKRVAQHLTHRQIEHFLPVFDSIHQWRDRKVRLSQPLFTGYVFVHIPLAERLKVLVIPNVVNLVGTRNTPSIISEEEITGIRHAMESGKVEPHPYRALGEGSWVVINAGAMIGMEGVLVRLQNSTRVLISLNSISQAFTVEVDTHSVELATKKMVLQHSH
jgi:transcription antitermination factor NusG